MKLLYKYLSYVIPILFLLIITETYFISTSTIDVIENELADSAETQYYWLEKFIISQPNFSNLTFLEKKKILNSKNESGVTYLITLDDLFEEFDLNQIQKSVLVNKGQLHSHKFSLYRMNDKHNSFFLISSSKPQLVLAMIQNTSKLNSKLKLNLLSGLVKVLGMLILFLVIAYFVSMKYIVHPLKEIKDHLRRISEGDFNTRQIANSRTEIDYIARLINGLAKELKIYQDNLLLASNEKINLLEKFRHQDRLKSIGQMTAGIAHELGTPLNVVLGRATLIQKLSKDEKILNSASIIKEETLNMTKIIQGLLMFSRKSKPQTVKTQLKTVIDHVLDLLMFESKKNKIKLESMVSDDSIFLQVESTELQQVLLNVVKNAIQASDSGGRVILEECSLNTGKKLLEKHKRVAEKYFVLSISDQGKGMSKETMNSIFDPFFTTKDVGQGTGLGLSVCHGIVTEFNGVIDFKSELGKGSVFYLLLPKSNGEK